MPDLIVLIPNHGYADETKVFVSWLNGNYFVHDPQTNSFKLEESVDGVVVQFDGTVTDGFVREVSEIGVTTITGLEYLEGESVKISANGRVLGTEVVVNGEVSLNEDVFTYSVGKNYDSTLQPMDLDIEGTAQATTKRVNRVFVNLYRTVGGSVGPSTDDQEPIPTGDALFTGFKEIAIPGGYTRDTDITIKQAQPLPMTVLSITYDLGASRD